MLSLAWTWWPIGCGGDCRTTHHHHQHPPPKSLSAQQCLPWVCDDHKPDRNLLWAALQGVLQILMYSTAVSGVRLQLLDHIYGFCHVQGIDCLQCL